MSSLPNTPTASDKGRDVDLPGTDGLRRELEARGAEAAFQTAAERLIALPTLPRRARCFLDIAAAFRQEHPKALLQLAQTVLAHEHHDDIALTAAALAHATGDPAGAEALILPVSPASPHRRRLEQQWRYDAALEAAESEKKSLTAATALALVEAAIDAAREDARGAFYETAHERIVKAEAIAQPVAQAFASAPAGGLRQLLQRLHLAARPPQPPPELRPLQRALKRAKPLREQLHATTEWLKNGMAAYPAPAAPAGPAAPTERRNILYLTFGSLPHDINGNTSRTHGLLSAMTAAGWHVRGITRPGFPQSPGAPDPRSTPLDGGEPWESSYRFDDIGGGSEGGVLYTNLPSPEAKSQQFNAAWKFDTLVEATLALARRDRPALIHGASNHLIGAAAIHAAERLGIPGIYELRGMWSLDYASKHPDFIHTAEHARMEAMEVDLARRATHVFAISHGIRNFLIERGIPGGKITLLPNGVHPDQFSPGPARPEILRELGLPASDNEAERPTVIGFVGTLSHYEGITLLVDALAILKDRVRPGSIAVVLIGNGTMRESVLQKISDSGLAPLVTALPAVPFHQVRDYLRAIDIVTIPRPGYTICERVTPIKPFEAMAMGKTVVASDVGGLTEVVTHGETGLLHERENAASLAAALEQGILDPGLRQRLGARAREFILQHHDWNNIVAECINPVYNRLAAAKLHLPSGHT